MSNGRVIVFGSINLDTVISVERIARPGETVTGSTLEAFPGGKGGNQALAAHRAGADVRLIGKVGNDSAGRDMLSFYADCGLATDGIARSDAPTGAAFIQVETGTAENSIVIIAGANGDFSPEDAASFPVKAGDIVVSQFEVPPDVITALFQRSREAGARTILNPAPFKPCIAPLLAFTDDLIVNESELAGLSGASVSADNSSEDIAAIARAVASSDDQTVIVTLGARGVVACAAGDVTALPGRSVNAVDTTGAGDCFVGAYAARRADGDDRDAALRFATAAASISVTRPGAASSMPDLDEINACLKD